MTNEIGCPWPFPRVIAGLLLLAASCGGNAGNGNGGHNPPGAGGAAGTGGTGAGGTGGGSAGREAIGGAGIGGAIMGSGGAGTGGNGGSAAGSTGRGGAGAGGAGGAVAGSGGSAGSRGGGAVAGSGASAGRGGSGGSGGVAGTAGGGSGGGASSCASAHPNVSGTQRTCNSDRCYCAADDGCYIVQFAAACCAGQVKCFSVGGSGGAAGTTGGTGGRGGTGGSAGSNASATDDFERASLGPNWTIVYPTSGDQVQIIGNSDLGMVPGPQGFFLANWTGSSFAADQYSEVVIPLDAASGWAYQPYVRRRASDGARYGFGLDNDPSQAQYYDKWYFKFDGVAGSETRMFALADNTTGRQPGPGDRLRVEIRGYALYGYWNGQLVLTATDTAANRISDGVPGVAARVASGNQAITQPAKVWESWAGGSVTQ